LGVLLWEICTGELPRRGQLRLLRVPEEAPSTLEQLIDRCLSADASARPTAQQVRNRLYKGASS